MHTLVQPTYIHMYVIYLMNSHTGGTHATKGKLRIRQFPASDIIRHFRRDDTVYFHQLGKSHTYKYVGRVTCDMHTHRHTFETLQSDRVGQCATPPFFPPHLPRGPPRPAARRGSARGRACPQTHLPLVSTGEGGWT